MEHRRGHRLAISQPVTIHSQQTSLGNFPAHNISAGGISIIDAHRRLSKGDFVQLQFYENHLISDFHYTKAIVIHRNDSHVGLMWVEDSTSLKSLLQTIVKVAA